MMKDSVLAWELFQRPVKPKAVKPAHKPFKAYEPGYLHIDVKYLPQMADEGRRRYLFVAIPKGTLSKVRLTITDPDARLYKKSAGAGAMLCFMGHTLRAYAEGIR